MDDSLDRNQLWSPPVARAPPQYHLQSQPEFLLSGKSPSTSWTAPTPRHSHTLLVPRSGQHGTPSSNVGTRRSHPSSQIQLEEHQPTYTRTHIAFPQQQRYVPDTQMHAHPHMQRRPFVIPQSVADARDDTPGPSHTSAEEELDEYRNGTSADADSIGSEAHEREARLTRENEDDAPIDEEPLYVNAKQYNRILKRRVARARLEELHRLSRQRKPYLHESRHKHAMRRPRGPGGRFLTAEEIAAQQKAAESSDPSSFTPNPNPSAEERKAMKAAEPTAVSPLEGAQTNGASFGEASAGPPPDFRPFNNVAMANTATNDVRDAPGGYPTAGPPHGSSSGPHVQFSNLNAAPPPGAGLR